MRRSNRSSLIAVTVVLIASLVMPSVAFAGLGDFPQDGVLGTTSTHPWPSAKNADSYKEYWWRQGWGNSLYPEFNLYPPASMETTVDGALMGIIYDVDRDPDTDLDETDPWSYYRSTYAGSNNQYGPNLEHTVDLLGIFASRTDWPDLGLSNPLEGPWYMHYNFYTDSKVSTRTITWEFKTDLTPPDPVNNLSVASGYSSSPAAGWVPTSRAHITWTPKQYDALAGVGYYQVLVDGNKLIPESDSEPEQGRVYDITGQPLSSSITVENMPAGAHEVSIVCVDRATNESVESARFPFYSDPDTPTIEWQLPEEDYLVKNSVVSVEATDAAGDPTVDFSVDGVHTATVSAPPYAFVPNTAAMATGSHSFTATVTDKLGRTVTINRTLTYDPTGLLGFIEAEDDSLNQVTGTSTTNPNESGDEDTWWREGWGNSLYPQFTFDIPSASSEYGLVIGMLYTLDRDRSTDIDKKYPGNYYRSAKGTGSTLNETIDVQGIYNYPPAGGWPVPESGTTSPLEGQWWLHTKVFTSKGYISADTATWNVGIDLTKPLAVEDITASPSLDPNDAGTWAPTSRAHISWTSGAYDALSGVAYYQLYIDDQLYVPESDTSSSQGRVYELAGVTPSTLTVEDMPAGKHKVSIKCVDRATNVGPAASTYFYSDPDTPKISITAPSGSTVAKKPTLSANATDAGGIRNVEFTVDGTRVGLDTSAPYSVTADLDGFSDGAHTLVVTATDMYGRTAIATKTITIDKTAPVLSSVSGSASPFYPVQKDGYRDSFKVSFKSNESGTAKLIIKNSSGKTVRTLSKSCSAGSNSITWDGKSSSGSYTAGTYRWTLNYSDSVGNSTSASTKSVVLKTKTDETPPKITRYSVNYKKTFYPRLRDGYRDNLKVKFKVNEAGTAKLTIKNSKGKVVRTITKSFSKGTHTIKWNGQYTGGDVKAGKFKYKLTFTDKAGNSSSTSYRTVRIKFYQLIKKSHNKLKVVER